MVNNKNHLQKLNKCKFLCFFKTEIFRNLLILIKWKIIYQIFQRDTEKQWSMGNLENTHFYFLFYLTQEESESEVKLLQSCPTLCDPVDCSLPGFSVHGILQARTLEWVAISLERDMEMLSTHRKVTSLMTCKNRSRTHIM